MKRKFWFYSFLILLSCTTWLSVEAQPYDSILVKLYNKYPQEKLYLHFDRSGYNPGETIWFKAYLFDGLFPSDMSKTLYAELLDEQGKVMNVKRHHLFFRAPLLPSTCRLISNHPLYMFGHIPDGC